MNDDKYERTLEELEEKACKWWPKEVRDEAQKISILQTLLDTQEKFISILKLADKKKKKTIFEIMDASNFSYNLFLKHLVVLTDFGSEPLQRVNRDFSLLFPNGKLTYLIDGKSIVIIINVMKKSKNALLAVCTLAIGYILVSALIIFNIEGDSFATFFDAIYWATVSLTTVGYGDIYPVTTAGRIITMISSMFGIAIVALPVGIITAGYLDALN